MDLIAGFKAAVRGVLGLPADPGQPPDLLRLGLYPARVDVCASDGTKCDVTPQDKRISPEKNVEVLVGIPGATAVVEPGAIVLLGWRRGDPAAPYCMPAWTIGATVDKLVVSATTMQLNGSSVELAGNAHAAPLFDTFYTDLVVWIGVLNTLLGTLVPGTGATGGSAYASAIALPTSFIVKMAVPTNYQSTKVKNG